ncbi:elongator complex protein 5 isoform X1 [Sitophilus oryzae]|uniref:Elongator complex protein 5 n=2 Tax=Sitophilus oryzae TaxID=7048 RepID=A0A6J2XW06_SITOR|nr:elongator complex protein 5 isoform X1 [Sitophilus oryzae]
MLKNYINTLPYTKFILVKDSVDYRDTKLLEYLVRQHLQRRQNKLHYFVYEGVFRTTQRKYSGESNVILYDCVTNPQRWIEGGQDENQIHPIVNMCLKLGQNDVVVVDALSNLIFQSGLSEAYKIFNTLKNNKAIQQIIVVLHKDLVEGDSNKTCMFFENLSTLCISVEPKFMSHNKRLQYIYKKSGGKVIQDIEEYKFEGDSLITSKISKPDTSRLLEDAVPKEINPENLSTFKIGLTDEEKLSRERVVLPYLPNANMNEPEDGKIFYNLDKLDDWDEEDPDDDLDV